MKHILKLEGRSDPQASSGTFRYFNFAQLLHVEERHGDNHSYLAATFVGEARVFYFFDEDQRRVESYLKENSYRGASGEPRARALD